MTTPSDNTPEPAPVRHLEFKATLLVLFSVLLLAGSAFYLMVARGVFEPKQQLVLTADDTEGVVTGMELSFSGFAVGRVRHVELDEQGNARIIVDVRQKDAHWLRESTVFTLVRGMLGNTKIRVHTPNFKDPVLPDGAVRKIFVGDATGEIPRLVATSQELLQNLAALTAASSPLNRSVANLHTLSSRLVAPEGALGALMGPDRQRVSTLLERSSAMMARADGLLARADEVLLHADAEVLGPKGVVPASRDAVLELTKLLQQTQTSLKAVDQLLSDAQAVASNAKGASADLGTLRAEVETSLRRVEGLVNEINRKWPFPRDTEVRLP